MSKTPENILIYRLGSLGDTVIALPCFNRIRECFPEADITLLTNKPVTSKAAPLEAILGNDYFHNRSLSYPVGTRNPSLLFRLIRDMSKLKIDLVINLTAFRSSKADLRDKLFFQAAGISRFIGFDPALNGSVVAAEDGALEWEALRLARKISALGEFDLSEDRYWDLHLTSSEQQKVNEAIAELQPNAPVLAISPGTKMPVKDWGRSSWIELVNRLSNDYRHYNLAVIGAAEESKLGDEILRAWSGHGVNFCGRTSPRVSAGVLARAELFLGHDSGPMHLAASTGTPCVAIFSCINLPKKWFPRGDNHTLLFPETACAKNGINRCSNPNEKCVRTIKPEKVEKAVREKLNLNVII